MNKLVKSVPRSELNRLFLQCLNGILELTNRELDLLTELLTLDIQYVPVPYESKNIVSTEARRFLTDKTGISPDNLSRYLTKFKKKGIMVEDKDKGSCFINPALIPVVIGNRTVQLITILKVEDDAKG